MHAAYSAGFFTLTWIPCLGIVATHSVSLSMSSNIISIIFHKHDQRVISQLILNSDRLTMYTSHHTNEFTFFQVGVFDE